MRKEASVICNAFIGDSLFASSVIEQLKDQLGYTDVRFYIRFKQPLELLRENPYIGSNVYMIGEGPSPSGDIFQIPKTHWRETPPLQFQRHCGIPSPTNRYTVYVPETACNKIRDTIENLRRDYPNIPIIAWQGNWYERTFLFTPQQYWEGVNIPNLGYGGARRNIPDIIDHLAQEFILIKVGLDNGVTQTDLRASMESYTHDASIIEQCDWFIGSEGGMSNLAAGIGTRCIITTDFIYQLYGPNGLFTKLDEPQMGPAKLFPERGHHHLDPFASDREVIESIANIVRSHPIVIR